MRDPLVHVEKTPMPNFGHGQLRNLIATATGLVGDLPKTVGTGCGKRRQLSQTSNLPAHVTCAACRDYARAEALKWADMCDVALTLNSGLTAVKRIEILAAAQAHRETAKAFE